MPISIKHATTLTEVALFTAQIWPPAEVLAMENPLTIVRGFIANATILAESLQRSPPHRPQQALAFVIPVHQDGSETAIATNPMGGTFVLGALILRIARTRTQISATVAASAVAAAPVEGTAALETVELAIFA